MKLLLACALLFGGCTSIPVAEVAWQGLHAIDTVQTLHIARDPANFHEVDSAWLVGSHPSVGTVAAWGVGLAGVHYGCARALAGHPLLLGAFEALSIADTGSTVVANWRLGL